MCVWVSGGWGGQGVRPRTDGGRARTPSLLHLEEGRVFLRAQGLPPPTEGPTRCAVLSSGPPGLEARGSSAGLGGGGGAEPPSAPLPHFLKGPARAGAPRGWPPLPRRVRAQEIRGLRAERPAGGLSGRCRLPPQLPPPPARSPPPFPALPAPPSLPPPLLPSLPPAASPPISALLLHSRRPLGHLKGQKRAQEPQQATAERDGPSSGGLRMAPP